MATQLKDMKLSDFALKGDSGCDGATFVLCDGDKIMTQCEGCLIYRSCDNPWCYDNWMFNGVSRCAGTAHCAESTCYTYSADHACYANEAYQACSAGYSNYADRASCAYAACHLYVDNCYCSSYSIQSITYDCLSSLPACARILYYV